MWGRVSSLFSDPRFRFWARGKAAPRRAKGRVFTRRIQGTASAQIHRLRALMGRGSHAVWAEFETAFPRTARLARFVQEVLRKYHHDDCFTYAAGISFFLSISLIPLATLFFKLMGATLHADPSNPGFQGFLAAFYPYLPSGFLDEIARHSSSIATWNIPSWIILVIGAHWGVNQLDRTLCHIFGLRIKRHRQTRKYHLIRRLGVVFVGLIFLLALLAAVFEFGLRRLTFVPHLALLSLFPALLCLILATLTLQHLPRRHVRFRHAFLGAFVSVTLWWASKWGFAHYYNEAKNLTWGVLYGSLSTLMAGLVFLYYSCCIFLLGAEITAAFDRHDPAASPEPGAGIGRGPKGAPRKHDEHEEGKIIAS